MRDEGECIHLWLAQEVRSRTKGLRDRAVSSAAARHPHTERQAQVK